MEWLKSKTTMIAGGCLALIGLQGYTMMSMRSTLEQRVGSIEHQLEAIETKDSARMSQLAAELESVTKRMGANAQDVEDAQELASTLKKENAAVTQRLRRELSSKADAKTVLQMRDEANSKLSELQQDAASKFAGVNGDVQNVRNDLNATREDLANSKKDLSTLIAHNSTELADLRRRGERDYVEFDIKKNKQFDRIADILVQLKKTDVKRQKFDVVINADDHEILKKERTANEPVTFLVGQDRVRYELVVNYVDKNRVRGYISTPKDKLLAAENPSLRRLQQ